MRTRRHDASFILGKLDALFSGLACVNPEKQGEGNALGGKGKKSSSPALNLKQKWNDETKEDVNLGVGADHKVTLMSGG